MPVSIGNDPRAGVHVLLAAHAANRANKSNPIRNAPTAPHPAPPPAPAPAPGRAAAPTTETDPTRKPFATRVQQLAGRTLTQGAENLLAHVHEGVGRLASALGLDQDSSGALAELLDAFHSDVKEQVYGALGEPQIDPGSIGAGLGAAFNDLRAGLQDLLAAPATDAPATSSGVDSAATHQRPSTGQVRDDQVRSGQVRPGQVLRGLAQAFEHDLQNLVSALQDFAPPSSTPSGFDVTA